MDFPYPGSRIEGMTELSPQIESSSVQAVEKFITRVWEHPLLDGKTRQHRQNALAALPPFMENHNIDASEYIGIPYGSFLWITDQESDFDFDIIKFDQLSHPDDKFTKAEIAARKNTDSKLHLFDIKGIDEDSPDLFLNNSKLLFFLLLTPDEYLLGNIEKAHELRLKAIDQIAAEPNNVNLYWDQQLPEGESAGMIQTIFEAYFKGWSQHTFTTRVGLIAGEKKGRDKTRASYEKRKARFEQNLAERSAQAYNPQWSKHFLQAFQEISVPPFSVYAEALRQTGGAIHINSKFAADTIEKARAFRDSH